MGFNGEIKYIGHVSDTDGLEFYKGVRRLIESMGDLYAEIQYQTTMQPDGRALFSALVIGRLREDE
jgi:hypothetical protein